MATKKTKIKKIFNLLPCMVLVLSGFYIFQFIELTQAEYNIGQHEEQVASLKKENAVLQLSLSQNKHLVNFENKITENGYNKIDKIDYLIISDDSLASK